ncbi:SGNH/GDSL hydrolase family protein [Streptomyces sp. NBRC 109706]|uniref:SGNH/GDSL hydrolase family protein n=1 Tax=Streptomyces sp. NBRC 109706 TaxID=1550035 RepID=UPI000781B17B|nr:SGNH/GDSL hydrolase family protein [Streptomyces sp. NBRC 109706]
MNPLLLPVVAVQGMRVRSSTEVLPPASGPLTGRVPAGDDGAPDDTSDDALRLGVLGESTAAGCGVDSHAEGFTGCLAGELAARTGRPVTWEVVGQHGATARRIRYRLLPEFDGKFDTAVLLAGVNDVLSRRSPRDWGDDLAAVIDELTTRAGRVVVPGIPAFRAFPSLPRTLARFLDERAQALDEVSRRVCGERPGALWVDSAELLPVGADFFSRDGFHPSGSGYRRWAGSVAGKLPSE